MTHIKICGITNLSDALFAIEAGADALGFIGVRDTPRYVAPEAYREMTRSLPPGTKQVVVVKRLEDADGYEADYVQYYEDSPRLSAYPHAAPRLIRAFRVQGESSLQGMAHDAPHPLLHAVVLDAYHPEKLGGAGAVFDWALAVRAKEMISVPVILAGGLTPDHIQEALEIVRPAGVDVSSGVESSVGIKDPGKVRAFIQAVREWDVRQPTDASTKMALFIE